MLPLGDVGAGLENALRAADLEPPDSRFRSEICCAVGLGRYFSGQVDEADRWFAETAALARAHEHWLVAASALAYGSFVAGERGQLDDQRRLAEEAAEMARARGLEGVAGETLVALGCPLPGAALGRRTMFDPFSSAASPPFGTSASRSSS